MVSYQGCAVRGKLRAHRGQRTVGPTKAAWLSYGTVRPADELTDFDVAVGVLGLETLEQQAASQALRTWVRRYHSSRYVPERLLELLHISDPWDIT